MTDREGEAIAWHLFKNLKLKILKKIALFSTEITKDAVKESFKNPRWNELVDAQQARSRMYDKLVGYNISPVV